MCIVEGGKQWMNGFMRFEMDSEWTLQVVVGCFFCEVI